MKSEDQQQLFTEIKSALAKNPSTRFAIIGRTPVMYDLLAVFRSIGCESNVLGVYSAEPDSAISLDKSMQKLREDTPDVAIVASDEQKELLLDQALPFLTPVTRILIAGYGHFSFRDPIFDSVAHNPLVPSLANGYPHTLVHIFQCLKNAARLQLDGLVLEFGMFKGGTTMLIAQFIEGFGCQWPVIGFDTFAGFPPRRSPLDMYCHPDCVFPDERIVRKYVEDRKIEVVSGDIVSTVQRVSGKPVVLAFVDTDNFTSASAVLDVIQDNVLVGGAILFDHFTGRNRFLYTLGERFAAKRLLDDSRYFNLHDTGVFIRQR
jgi:O-methyltransferase